MYQLHIANKNYSSWSLRPWVLLSELGIPFEEHLHLFRQGYGQNAQFRAFSPTALVPCLIDGEVSVWESLAIAEYVAEAHPEVWPGDKLARAFARSAASEMHAGFSTLRNICTMSCGHRIRLHAISHALQKDVDRLDALFNEGLSRFGGPFLGGHAFSAVDAFFAPVAFRAQTYDLPFSTGAQAYVDRLLGLESMQRWYKAALLETAREADHEAEIALVGTVVTDYRAGL